MDDHDCPSDMDAKLCLTLLRSEKSWHNREIFMSRRRGAASNGLGSPSPAAGPARPWSQGWLSENPSKAAAERFFLVFSAVWIAVFGSVVATGAYHAFGDVEYMALGLFVALPYFVWPLLRPFAEDAGVPWGQRYYVVANVWIAIFSYVGNYFWTHYFYTLLGAAYSFPVRVQLNDVPVMLYLITHGYFMFYHTLTTIALRRWHAGRSRSRVATAALVVAMAVFTAFMETFTIESVPYYSHRDKWGMYTVGSVVYGIYFYISFPMFHRVMETVSGERWTPARAAMDALAASMLVTIVLDLWRLALGGIGNSSFAAGLPWLQKYYT